MATRGYQLQNTDGTISSLPLKIAAGFGSDVQVDGGMEAWADASNMTNYDFVSFEPGVGISAGATLDRESSLIHGGTYAAKLTSTATLLGVILPKVAVTGSAGSVWRFRAWVRDGAGTGNPLAIALNDVHASATQIWNNTLQQWDSFTGWASVSPDSGIFETATSSYAQKTYSTLTMPASGKLVIGLGSSTNDTDPLYWDDADLSVVVNENTVTIQDNVNESTGSELTASDYVFKHRTTGGTDKNHLSLSGTGVYTTDYSTFNLADKPVQTLNVETRVVKSTQTTKPTATLTSTTLNDGAGSGASIVVDDGSTDMVGSFTVTAGNGTPTSGIAGQIVFNSAYATAPKSVMITAKNAEAQTVNFYVSASSTGSFQLSFGFAATPSQACGFYYMVVQ
jgi:hypothetical protein